MPTGKAPEPTAGSQTNISASLLSISVAFFLIFSGNLEEYVAVSFPLDSTIASFSYISSP